MPGLSWVHKLKRHKFNLGDTEHKLVGAAKIADDWKGISYANILTAATALASPSQAAVAIRLLLLFDFFVYFGRRRIYARDFNSRY